MSSVVRTSTPFINKQLLLKALDAVGCKYEIQGNTILTERQDYYGSQKFILLNGRYTFEHEKNAAGYSWGNINMQQYKTSASFIAAVGKEYNAIYKKQLEELERIRLAAIAEAERIRKEKLAELERLRKEQLLEQERLRKEQLIEQERLRLLAKAEEERKKAEEEKQRLERERKEFVAKQRDAVIAKAKEQGYDIQETVVDNKIKLVLVQTTY
jgi:vacuolar-type H+-ATPase subunit I/STV1